MDLNQKKPANQVQSRFQQQPRAWQAPKGRKVYRPVAVHTEDAGTSGTKDSLGREITSPAIQTTIHVSSPTKDHSPQHEQETKEVSNLPVTTSNAFAALDSYEDELSLHEQAHNAILTNESNVPDFEVVIVEEYIPELWIQII
ncbi:hypothetical protein FRX31_015483 [Thalictrum thalictroides]|uniref:Uncharacterized protein n=1 Tax=Thalictrum thalictroides TaxID=46969 RepID=A0A7J6WFS4_THATH|nr:hypothetical protein FRX31_015483 [Thalictrum thalictroides]